MGQRMRASSERAQLPYVFTSREMTRRGTVLVEFADRRRLIVSKDALRKAQ